MAELAELRVRAPDTQAVMTVLGRRALPPGKPQPLLLAGTDLRNASLVGAHLERADLHGAHLGFARLAGAHLKGASLAGTDLAGAYLAGTDLEGASATPSTSWPKDSTGRTQRST